MISNILNISDIFPVVAVFNPIMAAVSSIVVSQVHAHLISWLLPYIMK